MDHVDLLWSFSCVSFSKRVVFRFFFLWNIWFFTRVSFLFKIGHLIFMKHLIVFKWNSSSYCILYHIISYYIMIYVMVCFSGGKIGRLHGLHDRSCVVWALWCSQAWCLRSWRRTAEWSSKFHCFFLTCQSCHVQISGATNIYKHIKTYTNIYKDIQRYKNI
jgi:hypothetical protein